VLDFKPMEAALERLRRRMGALGEERLTTPDVLTRADALLRRAVPAPSAVWATVDPATGLFTSCLRFGLDDVPDRERLIVDNELDGKDVNLFSKLSWGPRRAAALSIGTAGNPTRSARYRELLADFPVADELRVAFVSRAHCWGTATLYRRAGERPFADADVAFAESVSASVGEALRLSMLRALADHQPPGRRGPGVVIVGPNGEIESSTSPAQPLLERLGAAGSVLTAISVIARASVRGDTAGAHARVTDGDGHWIELHGADLGAGRAAVVIEEAQAPALAAIIVDACGLTGREREVTELVLRGRSTRDISEALTVSEYTVQDHLKSVFEKTGVRSRRELAALLSDRFYREPRSRGASPGPYGWFVPVPAGGG